MSEVMERQATTELPSRETEEQATRRPVLVPQADIFEHDGGVTLMLDMPGVSRERLNIQSDRNTLLVEGDLAIDMPEDARSLYADIQSARYRRSFSLSGEQLDTEQVKASLTNGVLRIDIPTRAELRPRKIEVKAE